MVLLWPSASCYPLLTLALGPEQLAVNLGLKRSFVDSKSRIGYLSIHLVEHSFSRDPDPDTEMMCSERQGGETSTAMPGSGLRLTFIMCYVREAALRRLGPLATCGAANEGWEQELEPASWSPGRQGQG